MQQNNNSGSAANLAADQHQQLLNPAASSDDLNHSNSNQGALHGDNAHQSIKERLGNPKITFVLGKKTQSYKEITTTYINLKI